MLMSLGIVNAGWRQLSSDTSTTVMATHKYEVVSVRKHRSNTSPLHATTPDSFDATATVQFLIQIAYDMHDFQISGAPGWIGSALFDIQAKMNKSDARELEKLNPDERNRERRQMLQVLITDRFHLRAHRETKEHKIYALVIADDGRPKIRRSKAEDASRYATENPNRGALTLGFGDASGESVPISSLIRVLSQEVGRVVIDRTGLTGKYDFKLQWKPDQKQPPIFGEAEDSRSTAQTSGPSIFTAVQEQLGLKLLAQRGPMEILVIDHIEKPSEN